MESEIEHIDSELFNLKRIKKQVNIITKASEVAQAKIDYASAHDDNIIRAISIIETFLKKKHRLCYGGQAINAHLPSKYKFYDPNYSVPDYDFFTPKQANDIITIIKDLKKSGFIEISVREGMHQGTVKIYVDYIPVADLTEIDPHLYKVLSKREFKLDGISYLDANTLRMLMYLELSRPRGEVSRWSKVFERLALFNEFVSFKSCKIIHDLKHGGLNKDQLQFTINYIIKNQRIIAGTDLLGFYKTILHTRKLNTRWIFTTKKPIIFFSPESANDANIILSEFNSMGASVRIKEYSSKGIDILPSMKIISQGKKSLIFIISSVACYSYFNIPIKGNTNIKIASMDTLITLYFSLGLIESTFFNIGSIECMANKLVDISMHARRNLEKYPLPFISIKCVGYQPSFPSLIREKVKRITEKRRNVQNVQNVRNVRNTFKKSLI